MELLPAGMVDYPERPANFDRFPVTDLTWERRGTPRSGWARPADRGGVRVRGHLRGSGGLPLGRRRGPGERDPLESGPLVGEPAFDCVTFPGGKLLGLYSNVGEWSESRFIMYSPKYHPSRPAHVFVNGDAYFAEWKVSRAVRVPTSEILAGPFTPAQRGRETWRTARGAGSSSRANRSSPNLGFPALAARPRPGSSIDAPGKQTGSERAYRSWSL